MATAIVAGQFAGLSDSESDEPLPTPPQPEPPSLTQDDALTKEDERKYYINSADEFSEDDYSDSELDFRKPATATSIHALKQISGSKVEKSIHSGSGQPTTKALQHKYENKINIDKLDQTKQSHLVMVKDKSDRATTENVLDSRTRNVIFKFMRNEVITAINGCISTGKEANVYLCSTKDPEVFLALKIYKTSILVFKDRSSYTAGEFRFRRGYKGKNPRKMVTAWAEKEVRNLNRLHQTGKIQCPMPIVQRNNCLLMSFIGKADHHAPRLKDVLKDDVSLKKWNFLYLSTLKATRIMFQECKLVHADLSEYNMLYFDGDVVIIDVSQSVEHDHPNALTFLRKDCWNVNAFFQKRGVMSCTCREYCDFVTNLALKDEDVDSYLEKLMAGVAERGDLTEKQLLDDAVFRDSHIARRLDQIKMTDAERDLLQANMGDTSEILYANVMGLDSKLKPQTEVEFLEAKSDDGSNNSDSETEAGANWTHPEPTEAVPLDKKAHKKAVKEANRERRKTKMPKHEKKRKEKKGKVKK